MTGSKPPAAPAEARVILYSQDFPDAVTILGDISSALCARDSNLIADVAAESQRAGGLAAALVGMDASAKRLSYAVELLSAVFQAGIYGGACPAYPVDTLKVAVKEFRASVTAVYRGTIALTDEAEAIAQDVDAAAHAVQCGLATIEVRDDNMVVTAVAARPSSSTNEGFPMRDDQSMDVALPPDVRQALARFNAQLPDLRAHFGSSGMTAVMERLRETFAPLAAQTQSLRETFAPLAAQTQSLRETFAPLAAQTQSLRETLAPFAARAESLRALLGPIAASLEKIDRERRASILRPDAERR